MRVLIVLGSPRKNGNSETLVQALVKGLTAERQCEIEYIRLNTLNMAPCVGCGGCDKSGSCVVHDDMQALYHKVDEADRMIMTSPVYFYGISAQCKIFIDRFQSRWSRKYRQGVIYREGEGRKGYFVSTAAMQSKKVFEGGLLTVKAMFNSIELAFGGELLVGGVDERGDIAKKTDELQRAEEFGADIGRGIR